MEKIQYKYIFFKHFFEIRFQYDKDEYVERCASRKINYDTKTR